MLLRPPAVFSWLCALGLATALIQNIPEDIAQQEMDLETDYKVVGRAIEECSRTVTKYSCLANKAAMAMERAANWDIPIFGGLEFAVDDEKLQNVSESSRGFADGISRLSGAVAR